MILRTRAPQDAAITKQGQARRLCASERDCQVVKTRATYAGLPCRAVLAGKAGGPCWFFQHGWALLWPNHRHRGVPVPWGWVGRSVQLDGCVSGVRAEQGCAADRLQRPLVPRSRCLPRLTPGVRHMTPLAVDGEPFCANHPLMGEREQQEKTTAKEHMSPVGNLRGEVL
jgi:hypothetical protein